MLRIDSAQLDLDHMFFKSILSRMPDFDFRDLANLSWSTDRGVLINLLAAAGVPQLLILCLVVRTG